MSRVNDVVRGALKRRSSPVLAMLTAWSYQVTIPYIPGAYRGTVMTTQAGMTSWDWPRMRKMAETGPSDTLSYQPSLSEKTLMGALTGDPDLPGPPTTSSRPFSSVRSMANAMSPTFGPVAL